jgi:Putative Flp pilus-assembly TadE/G-like
MKTILARLAEMRAPSGQVIVLVALMIPVLVGIAGLAIDIGSAYSTQRYERTLADSAALAGAQDLQVGQTRTVPTAQYPTARQHAMDSLLLQLGVPAPGPACARATSSDIIDCPLLPSPYLASVWVGSPNVRCVQCDPDFSVKVGIRNPRFGVALARIFGFINWNVGLKSVAGLGFSANYALETLRPPRPLRSADANADDVNLNGTNTRVYIEAGDVGSNTNATTNATSAICVDPGYRLYHLDIATPDPWGGTCTAPSIVPPGKTLPNLLSEPVGYVFPVVDPIRTYATQAAGEDVGCVNKPSGVNFTYLPGVSAGSITMKCYKPGIYASNFNVQLSSDAAYLESDGTNGVFIFQGNLNVNGYLFGGLETGRPGVVLVLDATNTFSGTTAQKFQLNYGPDGCSLPACRAGPAMNNGSPVESPNGNVITFMVHTDDTCFISGTTPRVPQLCTSGPAANTGTSVINANGSAFLQLAGVIWAPTDNIKIGSNFTLQNGTLGQIVGWTVTYSGGAQLNQESFSGNKPGVLRLDEACSPSAAVCD